METIKSIMLLSHFFCVITGMLLVKLIDIIIDEKKNS